MKRRDFFGTSGCSLTGILLAFLGASSCRKNSKSAAPSPASPPGPTPEEKAAADLSSRKALVKKILMEKKGKTAQEADTIIADLEPQLDAVKARCICETCPSYVPEENETGFCHPFVGKSKAIKDEKGCDCGQCPVHKEMGLKFGYYCMRGSELEQEIAKA
jgi:hypothetical protein